MSNVISKNINININKKEVNAPIKTNLNINISKNNEKIINTQELYVKIKNYQVLEFLQRLILLMIKKLILLYIILKKLNLLIMDLLY